jgi:hypothetical protein
MSRLLHWLLVCSAALLLPAVAVQARPEPAAVAGLLVSVSPDTRPATITVEGEDGFITLEVTRRTSIFFSPPPPPGEGEPGEGFDLLLPGRSVEVAYHPKSLQALHIGVGYGQPLERVVGTLVGAPAGNLITVDMGGGQQRQLPFGDPSRFYLGNTRISQDQLAILAGSQVEITLTSGGPGIVTLRAVPATVSELQGRVESVDASERQLTVSGPAGTAELTIAAGAMVLARGGEVPPAAIEPGDRARVLVATTASGALVALRIQLPNVNVRVVNGQINAVNPTTRSINVSGRGGAANYRVLEGAPVTLVWHELVGPSTLEEIAGLMPLVTRMTVHVEYVVRDGARLATRVDARVEAMVPPPPPGR